MTTSPRGYVHISARRARPSADRDRSHRRNGAPDSRPLRAVQDGDVPAGDHTPRTEPTVVLAPGAVAGPRPVPTQTEARGFVVQVGLDESAASAAGTSLTWLANQLRHYVESIVPGTRSAAAVVIAPAGAPGSDLEVVRRVLGGPTTRPDTRPHPVPAPAGARQPGLRIDLGRREVRLDGEGLNLTYTEFELLNHLVGHVGRPVGRGELLDSVWGHVQEMPTERTIDVHMRRLRTKLGRLSGTVGTVRGQGYRFREHPEVHVWAAPEHGI
jgi:hypothetical protein